MDDDSHVLPVGASSRPLQKMEVIFKDDASENVLLRKKFLLTETIADIRKRDPSKNGKTWAELKSREFGEHVSVDFYEDAQEGVQVITFETEISISAEPDAIDELESNMCWALQKKIDQYSASLMALLQSEELAINDLASGKGYVSGLAEVDFLVQGGCCYITAKRNSQSSLELDHITIEELCSDTRAFADLATRIFEEALGLIE